MKSNNKIQLNLLDDLINLNLDNITYLSYTNVKITNL